MPAAPTFIPADIEPERGTDGERCAGADALEHGKLTVNGGRFKARVIDAEVVHHAHPIMVDPVGIYEDMKPGKVCVIVDGRNPDSDLQHELYDHRRRRHALL